MCDSLAPCPHWGTGVNSIDHCHASDKDEYWRAERKHVKNSDKPVKKIGKPATNICTRIDSFFKSIQENPNSLPQNQGFNPVTIRPCNLSSSFNSPNPMMGRVRGLPQPGNVAPRCNPQSQLASVQSHPRNNNTAASRVALGNKTSHWRSNNPLPLSQRAGIKRNGVVGASLMRSSTRLPPFQAPVTNGHYGSNQHLYGTQPADSVMPRPELSSPHNMDARHANYLPSQPQINSQPYSSCRSPDLIPLQSQMPSQLPANPISLPLPPYVYSQPSVGKINSLPAPEPYTKYVPDNHVPPQNVTSWQLDAGSTFSDRWHSGSTISSLSGVGNAFGNDSSQLQEHGNPTTSSLTGGQNDVHHQYHTQSGMGSSPIDFDFFCDSSVNHSNVQIHAEQTLYPSAETSQVQNMQREGPSIASVVVDNHVDNRPQQSAEPSNANAAYTSPLICAETSQIQNIQHNQPRLASLVVDNRPQQSVVVATAAAPTTSGADCQLPESKEPGPFDFEFLDSWMLENQSFSGAVEANALPDWNVYSPEAAFADTGTLFDL